MVPLKQRFPFSGAGLMLISEDPSTQTDKKPQDFNSNISQFLASLHNPGFHCQHFSQHTLISQALPEQSIKLWANRVFWSPNFQALLQPSTIQHSHVCRTSIPSLGTISISVCFLLLWLFSIAITDQNRLQEEGVYLVHLPVFFPSGRKVRTGTKDTWILRHHSLPSWPLIYLRNRKQTKAILMILTCHQE